MSQPLLSILIPTIVGREKELEALRFTINDETRKIYRNVGQVEIIELCDAKEMTIGEKREQLYKMANGVYSWQIDDDDRIGFDSILAILSAIEQNPCCVTFKENCMINGQYYSSNHSLKYEKWQDKFDGYDYVRCPFYKDVIKTEIAISVPFPYIRWNEDEQWSMAIRPHLKSEVHIDSEIYYYIHNSKPEEHNERYGIK